MLNQISRFARELVWPQFPISHGFNQVCKCSPTQNDGTFRWRLPCTCCTCLTRCWQNSRTTFHTSLTRKRPPWKTKTMIQWRPVYYLSLKSNLKKVTFKYLIFWETYLWIEDLRRRIPPRNLVWNISIKSDQICLKSKTFYKFTSCLHTLVIGTMAVFRFLQWCLGINFFLDSKIDFFVIFHS